MKKNIALLMAGAMILAVIGVSFSAGAARIATQQVYVQQPSGDENGTIVGIIYDKNGNPVDEAYVILFARGKILPKGLVISESDGTFEFTNVTSGQYRLSATKPLISGSGATTLFTVSAGATTIKDVWLAYGAGGGGTPGVENGTVVGTVYDKYNNPVDEAYVIVFPRAKLLPTGLVISDENGTFEFTNVTPGWYRLIATKPLISGSGATTLFYVSEGETITKDVWLSYGGGGGGEVVSEQSQAQQIKTMSTMD